MNTTDKLNAESVLAHLGWVRSLALQVAGHRISSDDVAQETWLRVLRNPPPKGVSMHDWIAGTARKVAIELSRQTHRRKERETIVAKAARAEAEAHTVRQVEIERDVVAKVMELKEPLRSTVLNRYFDNMSTKEIAARHDISVSAVNSRLSTAYASLRRGLTRQPDSVAGAFFCLALEDAAKAASGGFLSSGVLSGKPAALIAATLTIAGVGLYALRSDSPIERAAPPAPPTLQAAERLEFAAIDPTREPISVASAPRAELESRITQYLAKTETASPTDPSTIAAAQQGTLSVRVLDYRGEPVAEAPFIIRKRGTSRYSNNVIRAETGTNGEATEVDWTPVFSTAVTNDTELEVFAEGVGIATDPLYFHPNQVPTDPIDLVISEPFDTVLLECVDGEGITLTEDVKLTTMGSQSEILQGGSFAMVTAGTTKRIFPVGLTDTSSFLGSARAGYAPSFAKLPVRTVHMGTTHLRMPFAMRRSSLTFRLSAADAAAVAGSGRWNLDFVAEGTEQVITQRFPWTTDGVEFASTFQDASLAGLTGALTIRWAPSDARLERGQSDGKSRSATMEVTFPALTDCLELGEIQLEVPHALFQGRVLNSEGSPAVFAQVNLLEWKMERGAVGWHVTQQQRITTTEEGWFPCPSLPAGGTYALIATSRGELASSPLPWSPEDEHVELVLGPAAIVAGQVVLPASEGTRRLQIRAVDSNDGLERVVTDLLEADGSFELKGVTGDYVALELTDLGAVSPLARIEDIEIGGQSPDPRIQPWYLNGELQTLTIRVQDEQGEPVRLAILRTQGRRASGRDGALSAMVKNTPDLVTINGSGYREFSCLLPDLPETVTLRPGYKVDLVINAGPETAPLLDSLVVSLDRTERKTPEELALLEGDEWTREASKQAWTKRPSITLGEPIRLVCHQPGEYRMLFREKAGQSMNRRIDQSTLPEVLQEARLTVEDVEGVQTFRFEWP